MVRRGLLATRASARRAIEEGRVITGGNPRPKAATLVDETTPIRLTGREEPQWASRGGRKLAPTLTVFGIEVAGRRALDVGASTGGFTDVLLDRGAATVSAVDVGYGQLLWRLQTDDRVRVFDRTNFRHADPVDLGAPFELVVVDVSFISVGLLARPLASCGVPFTDYVVLVKPQFEVGRGRVGRRGVVTDPGDHAAAVQAVADALDASGIGVVATRRSPIEGAAGNREFFLHGRIGSTTALSASDIESVVSP